MSEGEIQIGEYELRNCVATGNVSQIWEVVERGGSQHFAMKLLLPEAFAESINKTTLKHEFKVGKSFDHPNVIRFYKIDVNRDHAYFIMDYFRAPSLKSQIASSLTDVQIRFRKLVEAVTLALGSIHEKGWLHRDIKPENILMNRGSEVKLIDFSLATRKANAIAQLKKMRRVQGTRTYIAPETLQKKKPTEQTDMYSLGITFYEALTGHPPFRGTSPNELLKKHMLEKPVEPSFSEPNITPECDAFILRLLAKKPKDRPKDMTEIYTEFRNLKVFKEDPGELAEKKREEAEQERLQTVDKRLDSRLDAERTAAGIAAPARPKKKKPAVLLKDQKKKEEPAPAPPQQQPAYPQPMPGQPMPGYMPQQPMQPVYQQPMYPPQQPMPYPQQMPGQPMPPGYAQPMPGQPMPGQPMPMHGQPMPGQPMPGQPMPGQPMPMPGQQMPGQPMPPQPGQPMPQAYPPAQPAPGQPAPQQPAPQQPAAEQPRPRLPLDRPQAPAPPKTAPDDLEEFTDLSEIDME